MLSFFRRFIGSPIGAAVALIFLGMIALAFAAGDVKSIGNFSILGGGGDTAAKVGGSSLSQTELQSRTQRVFEQARRDNPGLTMPIFVAQGGVDQIYDQLVASLAVSQYGADQGMSVSKRMVDAQIAAIPAFQDATGNFSQDTFRQLLSRQGVSEKDLREDITRELMGKQLVAPTGLDVKLPNSIVLPYASLLLEARQGRIAAIPAAAFAPKADPTPAQLQAFYTANAVRYTVPEQRHLRYAVIDASRFSTAAQPTDAEIQAAYNQNKAAYAASETRSVEQIILPTEAAAKAALASVNGGKTMAATAQAAGLSVSTLADQSREALTSAASASIAAAAFGAAEGAVAGPVRAPLGWTIIKVTGIKRTPAKSLEQARGGIAMTLATQKEQKLLSDFTGKIEDQIAEGTTFDEAAKDNGLTIETTPLLISTGQNVEDSSYHPNPDVTPLIRPGFEMAADDDAQLVPITQDNRYALLKVGDVVAAAPPPLDKVRALVTQQYKLIEGDKKAKALAEQVRAKIAKGAKLEDALAALGVPLPPVQKIGGRRADLLRPGQQPPAQIALLFSMAKGTVKALPIPQDQGYFIVTLDAIQQGDAGQQPQLIETVRSQLGNVAGQEYSDQFEKAIEKQLGVKRNPAVVAKVKQALQSTSAPAQ